MTLSLQLVRNTSQIVVSVKWNGTWEFNIKHRTIPPNGLEKLCPSFPSPFRGIIWVELCIKDVGISLSATWIGIAEKFFAQPKKRKMQWSFILLTEFGFGLPCSLGNTATIGQAITPW